MISPGEPWRVVPTSNDLAERVRRLARRNEVCHLELLRARTDWIAVPLPEWGFFTVEDSERLARAVVKRGGNAWFVVLIEDLRDDERCWHAEVAATNHRRLLRSILNHFNYALVDESLGWLLAKTSDDFSVLAGPREFIEDALGTSEFDARAKYDEFARGMIWPDLIDYLLLMGNVGRDFENAAVGETVVF
jgi:hypothetical protein